MGGNPLGTSTNNEKYCWELNEGLLHIYFIFQIFDAI
jgi:hypothetical protein